MNTQTATRRRAVDPLAPAPSASLPATIQRAAKAAHVNLDKPPVDGTGFPLEEVVQSGPVQYPPHMVRALLNVQAGVGAIAKGGWNDFQKYNYQRWDDVLAAVSGLLSDNGVLIMMTQASQSMSDKDALIAITYDIEIIHLSSSDTVSVWPKLLRWVGMARLADSKGVYDDKAAAKCHTQAHKNFLVHTFHIATDDTPDSDANDGRGGKPRRAADPQPQQGKPKLDAQEAEIIEPTTDVPERPAEVSRKGFKLAGDWAAVFLKAVRTSKTRAEVNAWRFANDENLKMVQQYDGDLHDRTMETVREIFTALPAETVSEAIAERADEATATAQAAARMAAKIPPPETEPMAFLRWLDTSLDACDADTLGDALNDTLYPLCERLPPEHRDVATSLIRAREAALSTVPGEKKAAAVAAEPKPDPEAELKAEIDKVKNGIELVRLSISVGFRAKTSNLPDDQARARITGYVNQRIERLKKGA